VQYFLASYFIMIMSGSCSVLISLLFTVKYAKLWCCPSQVTNFMHDCVNYYPGVNLFTSTSYVFYNVYYSVVQVENYGSMMFYALSLISNCDYDARALRLRCASAAISLQNNRRSISNCDCDARAMRMRGCDGPAMLR
jgi:hypothetical protein